MSGRIEVKHHLRGTRLKGSIDDLNAEKEHRRIGLRWSLMGDFLDLEGGPDRFANMANSRGVCEELAQHLAFGGVDLKWFYSTGESNYFEVRPGRVTQLDDEP